MRMCAFVSFQVKVYHPPPPGKGKNAKPSDAGAGPAIADGSVTVSIPEDGAHSATEGAKQGDL